MEHFITLLSSSKTEFADEYRRLYCGQPKGENLFLQILTELRQTITVSNFAKFKKLSGFIATLKNHETCANLKVYYENLSNPLKNTNLVLLTCKYKNVDILKYLLGNTELLYNLSINIEQEALHANNVDEEGHDAFYYAVRSNNVKLLSILIEKWSEGYFTDNVDELDQLLSIAYEEIKIKRIQLSEEMQFFVENKLLSLRFFSKEFHQNGVAKPTFGNIKQRIQLTIENINLLQEGYLNPEAKIDDKFLYVAKFIAQNIQTLKFQLKATYDQLPWEEIEFCLISYVGSYTKKGEINFFYRSELNKDKILRHLVNFAKALEKESCELENKDNTFPKATREEVIKTISSNSPEFKGLYNSYQTIRDICSLDRINRYIEQALLADPENNEGQLVIRRCLQVAGECLKNTLESPKLSHSTIEYLLNTLPYNTRQIICDVRNSLSHSSAICNSIEEHKDGIFFANLQKDIKKVNVKIVDIFFQSKMKTIRRLLKEIIDNQNLDEIREIYEVFSYIEIKELASGNTNLSGHEKIENLVKELYEKIANKTEFQEMQFYKIRTIIDSVKSKIADSNTNYLMGFGLLNGIITLFANFQIDIRRLHSYANRALVCIAPNSFKEIGELAIEILNAGQKGKNADEIQRLVAEILCLNYFEMEDNINYIEELNDILKSDFLHYGSTKDRAPSVETSNEQLQSKLSELKIALSTVKCSGNFSVYKEDKKLKAVIEMLVLDIMSILHISKKALTNNQFFIYENSPILTGKSLRNHLAHYNPLVDIMFSDPSLALFLNAQKLSEEEFLIDKSLGKSVKEDLSKLKEKYHRGLETVANQQTMFEALQKGNLEELKSCIKKGADVLARSNNLWTTLHFAAKGPNLEVVKFITDQNLSADIKDINGQVPLHIAAENGRLSTVEYFIQTLGSDIHQADINGKTSLHLASENGHKDMVLLLLKYNADTFAKDKCGMAPLHLGIQQNHIETAKLLLEKEKHVDVNESLEGFTALHWASDGGHVELINFLLENKANVNAKTDRDSTPLHVASLNGRLEAVKVLILNGADLNATIIDGCTPLHYAIEDHHEDVAKLLIEHGANVNAIEKFHRNTPLHYASKYGQTGIVRALLENKANIDMVTSDGATAWHYAIIIGSLEIIVALLSIKGTFKNADALLRLAAEKGHKEIVELLLKNKAKVNGKDTNGFTALFFAALNGQKAVAEVLIKNNGIIDPKTSKGLTPLHAAAAKGHTEVAALLIEKKANLTVKDHGGKTPLHAASNEGHFAMVELLVKNGADINARDNLGSTPLAGASLSGHKEVVESLIKNGANLNAKDLAQTTPLFGAILMGKIEIVEILVNKGAKVNIKEKDGITPLFCAVKQNRVEIAIFLISNNAKADDNVLKFAVEVGNREILKRLIKSQRDIKLGDVALLHIASQKGHKGIVQDLIEKGANVNAATSDISLMPLHAAVEGGHYEIVEVLLKNGADIEAKTFEDMSALHLAADKCDTNVVEILLRYGAKANKKDLKNRTPLGLAVGKGFLPIVKLLMEHTEININARDIGNNGYSALLVAAQAGNLDVIKHLLDHGANIKTENVSGSKVIHIAAREGHKDAIEFFLTKGFGVNEPGTQNQTPLHYSAIEGHLEAVKFLLEQGADINAPDIQGVRTMHIAAMLGHKHVVEVLLKNGALYNIKDNSNRTPLEYSQDDVITNLLESIKNLFAAVKSNAPLEVQSLLNKGAMADSKNVNNVTPLHMASCKGNNKIVSLLLNSNANPNIIGKGGSCPLHYSVNFSHLAVVKTLLLNGAIYDALDNENNSPLYYAKDKDISDLLKLVDKSFQSVKKNNSKLIDDLKKIKDIDIVKVIMNARNRDNRTIIAAAMLSNYSEIDQLKDILQDDVQIKILGAEYLYSQSKFQEALPIFRSAFESRRQVLGPDNPATLEARLYVAMSLYKLGSYQEGLQIAQEIYQKQSKILGPNHKDSLKTENYVALILHRQGHNDKALPIFQRVYQHQKEMLGEDNVETLNTLFHMAIVLLNQNKLEEALEANQKVYAKYKHLFGLNHPTTLSVLNNIAMVLLNQQKFEEATKSFKEVYKRRKEHLGAGNADTLRTLHHIATILSEQKKYDEALKAFQEVLALQKQYLGPNHFDALTTQCNIGNLYFAQNKFMGAYKYYKKTLAQRKAILGSSHPHILDTENRMQIIDLRLMMEGTEKNKEILMDPSGMNNAASSGDKKTVLMLLNNGYDPNDTDGDGRTALHFAVDNGDKDILNILLLNGADATRATNKGNTPLHTAVQKDYKEIAEILLDHVSPEKRYAFVNTQTTAGGTTALHVAADRGSLELAKSLLKHNAAYDLLNKKGKTPLKLTQDKNLTNLLNLINDLYKDAAAGKAQTIDKLLKLETEQVAILAKVRNRQEKSLAQVAMVNKHKELAKKMLHVFITKGGAN